MDGITDTVFRTIVKKYGNPDIMYTEFSSVEGICHGATALLRDFLYEKSQRPIIAQIFGKTPQSFYQTAILLCELGFDGIDLNMGCSAKNVANSGSGAALIETPKLAQKIVNATKKGVEDWINGKNLNDCVDITDKIRDEIKNRKSKLPAKYKDKREIPVSVKTRIGVDEIVTTDWINTLLETKPAAIAVHGRTLKQAYTGKANWEEIAKAAELAKNSETIILGNGDVKSRQDAEDKAKQFGVDGVLIGRAVFGNPFVFQKKADNGPSADNKKSKIFQIALEHAKLFEQTYQNNQKYTFLPMRKHLAWYVKGIEGAAKIRSELVRTNSSEEVEVIFKNYGLM